MIGGTALGPVVVDTGVFGAGLSARGAALAERYRELLTGRQFVISIQTLTELYFGALKDGWGERRFRQIEHRVAQVVIAPCDDELARVCAGLRFNCLRQGHGLAQKIHTTDLWIAATAVQYDIPLVSDDRVFVNVPGLTLLTVET